MNPLPIDDHLPQIKEALLSANQLIVVAPPGTGKTTRIAPALLDVVDAHQWTSAGIGGKVTQQPQIVLIQPRRVAARSAASRIAFEAHSRVGDVVGYQVRFERQVGPNTRLVCMTPGILLRQLQDDPLLERVSVVILDEFHERSLEMDLLLGMLRRIQCELRTELRVVIMSATLDTESLVLVLGRPPMIQVAGISYPVDIRYVRQAAAPRQAFPVSQSRRISEQVAEVIQRAALEGTGDILAFLPGVGEIRQVARLLDTVSQRERWELLSLSGDMAAREQDRALAPSPRRKVILATNVAETSLTIDGVRVVVDSGWARVQRLDPAHGLNQLVLEPISQASATQRAGRAGRTAPGICYRLWDEVMHRARPAQLEPEVQRVELTGAALQLASWGERDVNDFPWLTQPREEAWATAVRTLEMFDAMRDGQTTGLGQRILKLPVQPRIARFLIEADVFGILWEGCLASALLSERDIFDRRGGESAPRGNNPRAPRSVRQIAPHPCDLALRVRLLQRFVQTGERETPLGEIRYEGADAVLRVAHQFYRLLGGEPTANASLRGDDNDVNESGQVDDGAWVQGAPNRAGVASDLLDNLLPQALLAAYPDRVARRRAPTGPRGLMVGGRGVKLDDHSGVQRSELFLCLDVDGGSGEALVRQASGIETKWLDRKHLREVDERFFNATQGSVATRRRIYWFDLMLSETPVATPADEETASLLAKEAAKQFDRLLPPKDKELHAWLARIKWLQQVNPDCGLPSLAPESLSEIIAGWCFGRKSLNELRELPWKSLLMGLLTSPQRQMLDQQAPEAFRLPSGRAVLLQYELGRPPVLAARIQEFFGLKETPRLAGGRVPLLLHLLAPNNRCQQITDDLASFWKSTYPTVRKELRGRYPKHAWPEDPHVPGASS